MNEFIGQRPLLGMACDGQISAMTEVQTSEQTIILVRDLMFLSRIGNCAQTLGVPIRSLREPARLAGQAGRRLIVDLNLDGAIEAAAAWKTAFGGEVVGFVSHTDTATIARATAAGVDRVMARSAFVQTLPQLLKA